MITDTYWLAVGEMQRALTESDLMVLCPYKNSITIMYKHGAMLAQAKHDGTDERGDIENLKTLCLIRFNTGESNDP